MTPRSFLATVAVVAALIVAIALTPANWPSSRIDTAAGTPASSHEGDHRYLLIDDVAYALATPCPTEDSPDCYWDAQTMGNGSGISFVNVGGNIFPTPSR